MRAEDPPCRLCGAAEPHLPVLTRRALSVARCPRCGGLRRVPAPSPEELARFYREEYAARFGASEEDPARGAVFEALLDRLGPAEGGRLLDLGAGRGAFLDRARRRGWRVDGTELAVDSRRRARERYGIVLRDPETDPPPDGAYDVVCLVNVLDQAPDPASLLATARRALRPGGRLLVRVPNAAFHLRVLRLAAIAGPRLRRLAVLHAHGLDAGALERVLRAHGFDDIIVRGADLGRGPLAASRLGRLVTTAARLGAGLVLALSRGGAIVAPSLEAVARRVDRDTASV